MTPEARKKQLEKMQKTTAGKAGKALQDMYNKKKKKKKKKKIGLFDRLREMGRNISSTLTAPQRRVAKEKMERRMEASGIKSQSGESRMRKGKLYETAPKGTRKTGEDKFAPPMSRRKASGEDRFAPKGAGGKAKKFMETKSDTVSDKQKTLTQTNAMRARKARLSAQSNEDRLKAKADSMKDRSIKAAKAKAGTQPTKSSTPEPKNFKEAFRQARAKGVAKFEYPKGSGKMYAAVTMDEVKRAKKQGKIEKATLGAYLRMMKKRKK